jgi:NADPH2:quinone reductase
VQFAVALGMIVIGTGGTDEGRKLVKEQGAAHVLDHKSPGYLDELKKITGGRGVDLIIELAAHQNLGKDLTVLRKNGRIVVIGSRGKVEIDPRGIMSCEAHVVGLSGGAGELLLEAHAAIGAGLRSGALRPIIGSEIPLSEAARAHHEIIEKNAAGKMVLIP